MGVMCSDGLVYDPSGGEAGLLPFGSGYMPQIARAQLRDKAEAMRAYAQQAGDHEFAWRARSSCGQNVRRVRC